MHALLRAVSSWGFPDTLPLPFSSGLSSPSFASFSSAPPFNLGVFRALSWAFLVFLHLVPEYFPLWELRLPTLHWHPWACTSSLDVSFAPRFVHTHPPPLLRDVAKSIPALRPALPVFLYQRSSQTPGSNPWFLPLINHHWHVIHFLFGDFPSPLTWDSLHCSLILDLFLALSSSGLAYSFLGMDQALLQ